MSDHESRQHFIQRAGKKKQAKEKKRGGGKEAKGKKKATHVASPDW